VTVEITVNSVIPETKQRCGSLCPSLVVPTLVRIGYVSGLYSSSPGARDDGVMARPSMRLSSGASPPRCGFSPGARMLLAAHVSLPLGFIAPLPATKAQQPPTGEAWLHEIKHDEFRVIPVRSARG
jgi:hypothetical protein